MANREETTMDNMEFAMALQEFFEENDEILFLDNTNEFTEQVEENFKATTEAGYDPFKSKLEKTMKQYQMAI